MEYENYRDGVQGYWGTIHTDWEAQVNTVISNMNWKIDQSFLDSHYLEEEPQPPINRSQDDLPFYSQNEAKAEELAQMEPGALAKLFLIDINLLGKWIAQHPDLPEQIRFRLPQFLGTLTLSEPHTLKRLQSEIRDIKAAKDELLNSKEYRLYYLALCELWMIMNHIKGLVLAWARQKHT